MYVTDTVINKLNMKFFTRCLYFVMRHVNTNGNINSTYNIGLSLGSPKFEIF